MIHEQASLPASSVPPLLPPGWSGRPALPDAAALPGITRPVLLEERFALEYLGYQLQRTGARSVRLATESPSTAALCALLLPSTVQSIVVQNEAVRDALNGTLGLAAGLAPTAAVDAVVLPFADGRMAAVPPARWLVGCTRNQFGYRALLSPWVRSDRTLHCVPRVLWQIRRQGYRVREVAGTHHPLYMAHHTLSLLAHRLSPAAGHQLADRARLMTYVRGPMWVLLSHVVAFVAERPPPAR